jgi:hypothetical protein
VLAVLFSCLHDRRTTDGGNSFQRLGWAAIGCFEPATRRGAALLNATYLSHLRHGAFPSPLLDWTLSPYVAAYFSFHNATHDGDVAIYAYREWAANLKIGGSDDPRIVSFGPIIKTHRRHYRQQSRYTTCVQFEGGKWAFTPHDAVFGQKDRFGQDLLWKVRIPATERLKVLRFCDKVNLNGFTLFESEEGLLELQAMRVFDLRP